MRSIEEKIDIPESRKDDFRREIMNYIGALAIEGKKFDYKTNERLHKALELKLFEDQKDSIKLTTLVSNVVDKDTQEKIDVVKQRLIKNFGYNEVSRDRRAQLRRVHLRARRRQVVMSDPARHRAGDRRAQPHAGRAAGPAVRRARTTIRRACCPRARPARDGAAHERQGGRLCFVNERGEIADVVF